jgi:outer membrane receptor for ferrienterochelin and colicin
MRRNLFLAITLLVLSSLVGTLAFAESARGSLGGRVADRADAVLPGAQVELLPNGGKATSNAQGEFTFTGVAPGTYTLFINYVGFEPFKQEVTITAGKNTFVKAVVSVSSKNEEVTVFSGRESGEVEAINRTRTADNIVQVLPAEVITSLPNANVADALGRLPSVTLLRIEGEGVYIAVRGTEPRLTNITVNGITIPSPEPTIRQVRLDVIPSDLVGSVEINKTLSASQDGDGIGGSVNLRTKTATDQPLVNIYRNSAEPTASALEKRRNSAFSLVGRLIGTDAALTISNPQLIRTPRWRSPSMTTTRSANIATTVRATALREAPTISWESSPACTRAACTQT